MEDIKKENMKDASHQALKEAMPDKQKQIKMYNYKLCLSISITIFLLTAAAFGYLIVNDKINYDIDLKGGLQIVITMANEPDIKQIENILNEFGPVVRSSKGLTGWSLIIQTDENVDYNNIISKLKDVGYDTSNWSVQRMGAVLGKAFLSQSIYVLFIAFIFMVATIFYLFRAALPSTFIVFSGAIDIFEAFVFSQLLGIPLSIATFTGLLLLIGYSVDTNILLTTRVLRSETGAVMDRIKLAFKTGMTMIATSIVAVLVLFFISGSQMIMHIAAVLVIGLFCDIINTWLTNASLIQIYAKRKGMV